MKHVNLTFWEKLFKTVRKTFYNKTIDNPLEYHITDAKIPGKQQKPTKIKDIMSSGNKITIQNAQLQEKSWEITGQHTTMAQKLPTHPQSRWRSKHRKTKSKANNTEHSRIKTTS